MKKYEREKSWSVFRNLPFNTEPSSPCKHSLSRALFHSWLPGFLPIPLLSSLQFCLLVSIQLGLADTLLGLFSRSFEFHFISFRRVNRFEPYPFSKNGYGLPREIELEAHIRFNSECLTEFNMIKDHIRPH